MRSASQKTFNAEAQRSLRVAQRKKKNSSLRFSELLCASALELPVPALSGLNVAPDCSVRTVQALE